MDKPIEILSWKTIHCAGKYFGANNSNFSRDNSNRTLIIGGYKPHIGGHVRNNNCNKETAPATRNKQLQQQNNINNKSKQQKEKTTVAKKGNTS